MIDQPLLLLPAFLVFWFGSAAIMSRIAGWHVLSALFPLPPDAAGEHFRFCSARLGTEAFSISYRRCVRVVLCDDGLALRLMFPFRFHSPPFFVPWHQVSACTEKQVILTRRFTLSFHGTNRQVTFAGPIGQLIRDRVAAATAGKRAATQAAPERAV